MMIYAGDLPTPCHVTCSCSSVTTRTCYSIKTSRHTMERYVITTHVTSTHINSLHLLHLHLLPLHFHFLFYVIMNETTPNIPPKYNPLSFHFQSNFQKVNQILSQTISLFVQHIFLTSFHFILEFRLILPWTLFNFQLHQIFLLLILFLISLLALLCFHYSLQQLFTPSVHVLLLVESN